MPRTLGKLRRGDELGEIQQEILDICTVVRSAWGVDLSRGKTLIKSTIYVANYSRDGLSSVDCAAGGCVGASVRAGAWYSRSAVA
jgi:hypothetical protein